MIRFHSPEHLLRVLQFAVRVGAADKLIDRLTYLNEYADGNCICQLYQDWAPHSFGFVMERPDGTRWFNGGLIYFGPEQPPDGSAPALTVGIGIDSSQHSWSIHT